MKFDLLAFLGRFEPFHLGHASVVRQALLLAERVLILIGSQRASCSMKNPFSFAEREALIRMTLTAEENRRVAIEGIEDYYDNGRWKRVVAGLVSRHAGEGQRVGHIGHRKDGSSDYLDLFPDGFVEAGNATSFDATTIRRAWFFSDDWQAEVGHMLAPAVVDVMESFRTLPLFADLREEWQAIERIRAPYKSLPYEPFFATGDAVVHANGKYLMIRRGRAPGKGLWALPGGFVERWEFSLDAAIRELAEETIVTFPATVLAGRSIAEYLKAHCRFDLPFESPYRSLRGRINTRAFFFDLPEAPDTALTEEACAIGWFTPAEIERMKERTFEDHAFIVETMHGNRAAR